MGYSHFSERPHKGQRDRSGGDVAEDHAGASEPDGKRAAEKKSRADGTSDGDHGELSRREIAVEARFAFQDTCGIRNVRRGGSQGLGHGAGIVADRLPTANADSRPVALPGLHESTAKGGQLSDRTQLYFDALLRKPPVFTIAGVVKEQRFSPRRQA